MHFFCNVKTNRRCYCMMPIPLTLPICSMSFKSWGKCHSNYWVAVLHNAWKCKEKRASFTPNWANTTVEKLYGALQYHASSCGFYFCCCLVLNCHKNSIQIVLINNQGTKKIPREYLSGFLGVWHSFCHRIVIATLDVNVEKRIFSYMTKSGWQHLEITVVQYKTFEPLTDQDRDVCRMRRVVYMQSKMFPKRTFRENSWCNIF